MQIMIGCERLQAMKCFLILYFPRSFSSTCLHTVSCRCCNKTCFWVGYSLPSNTTLTTGNWFLCGQNFKNGILVFCRTIHWWVYKKTDSAANCISNGFSTLHCSEITITKTSGRIVQQFWEMRSSSRCRSLLYSSVQAASYLSTKPADSGHQPFCPPAPKPAKLNW